MDEHNCICCLDSIQEKPQYHSCTLCRNIFIDNECMLKLFETNRIFCPVCNVVELKKFNNTKNTELKIPEIVLEIPTLHKCSQCSDEFTDIISHIPECKYVSCPFCQVTEKKENKEIFYHTHVQNCATDTSLKEVLQNNNLYHIMETTFYQNLKKGQRVDAFLKISSTTIDNCGLYDKFYIYQNSEKFAFAIETIISSIHDDYLMLYDIWFQREIKLPKILICYIAPANTYVPKWRHLLSPDMQISTNWYEKIKYKIIEKVEITHKTTNCIDLNIVLGYIINISPDDPNMLIVDFGSNGITYVSRYSEYIRPTGMENEVSENLQIMYNQLVLPLLLLWKCTNKIEFEIRYVCIVYNLP